MIKSNHLDDHGDDAVDDDHDDAVDNDCVIIHRCDHIISSDSCSDQISVGSLYTTVKLNYLVNCFMFSYDT